LESGLPIIDRMSALNVSHTGMKDKRCIKLPMEDTHVNTAPAGLQPDRTHDDLHRLPVNPFSARRPLRYGFLDQPLFGIC
jgi:hypothetical protein